MRPLPTLKGSQRGFNKFHLVTRNSSIKKKYHLQITPITIHRALIVTVRWQSWQEPRGETMGPEVEDPEEQGRAFFGLSLKPEGFFLE